MKWRTVGFGAPLQRPHRALVLSKDDVRVLRLSAGVLEQFEGGRQTSIDGEEFGAVADDVLAARPEN